MSAGICAFSFEASSVSGRARLISFPDESAKCVWLAMHVSACSNNEKMRVAVASCWSPCDQAVETLIFFSTCLTIVIYLSDPAGAHVANVANCLRTVNVFNRQEGPDIQSKCCNMLTNNKCSESAVERLESIEEKRRWKKCRDGMVVRVKKRMGARIFGGVAEIGMLCAGCWRWRWAQEGRWEIENK